MNSSALKNMAAKAARRERRTNTYGTTKQVDSQFAQIITTQGYKRHLRDAQRGHKAARAIHLAHVANYMIVPTFWDENAICYGRKTKISGTRYARNARNTPFEE
jgi:hypothetical protein